MFCQLAKQLHDLFSRTARFRVRCSNYFNGNCTYHPLSPLPRSWHLVHPLAASLSPNPRLKTFYAVAACGIKLNGCDKGEGRREAEGDRMMMRSVGHRWRRWRGKLLIYIIVTFMPRLGFGMACQVDGVEGGRGVAVAKRVIRLKRLSRRCCFCLQCNALFTRN